MSTGVTHAGITREARRASAATLCSLALAAALTALAREGPEPLPDTAPAHVFSAGRALQLQRAIVGDGAPRSPGSPANTRALEQIAQALTRAGLTHELQRSFVCGAHGCGYVTNMIASRPGREPGSILLIAHHDSVAAGPGASDDAAGVAVLLETARALANAPSLRHGVHWLFTDAEEAGCLGARAFAAEHRHMADVRAVINVDNGGTSGPVLMYGTGPAELARVELYARVVQHPISSSLLGIGHSMLPRDSDFRVFRERGLSGFDFAYAAGEARYHTARDDLAHAARTSLQHEGDHVLACARALADADLAQPAAEHAAWFDVFGLVVLRWPARASLWLALGCLALLALAAYPEPLPLKAAGRALVAAGGATLGCGLLAWGADWLLAETALVQATFVRQPGWLLTAMLGLSAMGVLTAARLLEGLPLGAAQLGLWLSWAALALLSSLFLPGASVMFLPLPLTAAVCRLLLRGAPRVSWITQAVAALSAGAVYCPALALALDTFGVSTLAVLAAPAAWLGSALLPELGALGAGRRRALFWAAAVSCGIGLGGHSLAGSFDAHSPARINVLAYSDGSAGQRYGIIDTSWIGPRARVPPAMRAALTELAGRSPEQVAPLPWRAEPALRAALPGSAPGDDAQTVRATLRAQRQQGTSELELQLTAGVRRLLLVTPDAGPIRALRVEGRVWPSVVQPGADGQRHRHWSMIAPQRVQRVQLVRTAPDHAAGELLVVAESAGVPQWLAPLLRARPRWAAASQSGDRSLVSLRLAL